MFTKKANICVLKGDKDENIQLGQFFLWENLTIYKKTTEKANFLAVLNLQNLFRGALYYHKKYLEH